MRLFVRTINHFVPTEGSASACNEGIKLAKIKLIKYKQLYVDYMYRREDSQPKVRLMLLSQPTFYTNPDPNYLN